jgi:hypothetical protein
MPDVKATTLTITMIAENKFTSLNIDAPPLAALCDATALLATTHP